MHSPLHNACTAGPQSKPGAILPSCCTQNSCKHATTCNPAKNKIAQVPVMPDVTGFCFMVRDNAPDCRGPATLLRFFFIMSKLQQHSCQLRRSRATWLLVCHTPSQARVCPAPNTATGTRAKCDAQQPALPSTTLVAEAIAAFRAQTAVNNHQLWSAAHQLQSTIHRCSQQPTRCGQHPASCSHGSCTAMLQPLLLVTKQCTRVATDKGTPNPSKAVVK